MKQKFDSSDSTAQRGLGLFEKLADYLDVAVSGIIAYNTE